MPDVIARYQGAPLNGPFQVDAQLLNGAALGAEGIWIPAGFAKASTIEITGVFSTFNIDIYGSNQQGIANQQSITVAGSVTTSDLITLTFANANLANATPVTYTTIGGDTTTTIATALAAAINASTALAAVGITATSVGAVITVAYPSVSPGGNAGDPTRPQRENITTMSATVGGSATETLAFAPGTNGTKLQSVTAAGIVMLNFTMLSFKARVTALTGSSPLMSAAWHGVG